MLTGVIVLGLFGFIAYRYFQQKPTSLSEFKIIPGEKATPTPALSPETSPVNPKEFVASQIKDAFARKYQKPAGEIKITVNQLTSDYARGTVNFTGETSTGWWLAVKEKGGWLLVVDGNGNVMCQAIENYDFPVTMVPECYNQVSRKLIKR